MPGYQTGRATLLRTNQQVWLFQQEQVAAGRASVAVMLERVNRSFYVWGVSFQVYFTDVNGNPADPGTFELDVQGSDIDQDNRYCTVATINSGLNASFTAVWSTTSLYMKYVRVLLKTLTNAVYTSVLLTR